MQEFAQVSETTLGGDAEMIELDVHEDRILASFERLDKHGDMRLVNVAGAKHLGHDGIEGFAHVLERLGAGC